MMQSVFGNDNEKIQQPYWDYLNKEKWGGGENITSLLF